jgi:aspartyl-tRNA(Asn)/glutamyl-tRNA(Gln) amidotransferase subunit A
MINFEKKTIFEINNLLNEQKISVTELTEYFLGRVKEEDKKNSAFLHINNEALKDAQEIDETIKQKEKIGLFCGIPTAIKDNILIKGQRATAGSMVLNNYVASYDATVIKKLRKEKTIFLGKTNLDEFAMGSSTENSAFFVTKNPHDTERVPGGSSGGSAAAVAGGECLFALGSDTGGSIRQPAAFCGVVGLKPTYGSVSRYGLISLASSLDVIGPLTKTVKESAYVFDLMRGKDFFDATSKEDHDVVSVGEIFNKDAKKLKIGIPIEYFSQDIDKDIKKNIDHIIEQLTKKGFSVEKTSLPHTDYALATYYIIMPSEASANLARYDNLRYGQKSSKKQAKHLIDIYIQNRNSGFGNEVRRRIILGTYALSSGYYDDYYIKAQEMRQIIRDEFSEIFKKYDILLTPTTPTPAFKVGAKISPLEMYLSDIFTVPANLAGLPAISLPCGKVGKMPIGMQLIGKPFREEDIFLLADYLEQEIIKEK